jgi:hypothetical protein
MLRLLVAALLAANLLFWAWHHTPLPEAVGLSAGGQGREPERLERQFHPEAIQLLKPGMARPGSAASAASEASQFDAAFAASAPRTLTCLEAGPLTDGAASAAVRELAQAGVPAGGWVDMRRDVPGRWVVYMGRYADREAVQRKVEELQRLGITATELRAPPELAPGLALGDFGTAADAQARLDRLQARGVRTARLQQLPPPGAEHRVRIDRVDAPAAQRLAALSGQSSATRWLPCAP